MDWLYNYPGSFFCPRLRKKKDMDLKPRPPATPQQAGDRVLSVLCNFNNVAL